jgi:hypothetical protein
VHENFLIGRGIQVTHLVFAAAESPVRPALLRYFAEFMRGGMRCFVAGVFVEDPAEQSREGWETGADDANGDFGVSARRNRLLVLVAWCLCGMSGKEAERGKKKKKKKKKKIF